VACGASRVQALEAAEQMLLGTAALLLETGEHPASLKDRVCSPGGSTICGVRELEKAGFRAACAEAVIAACEKKF
jgi:pyrroline-5-carboxylate reductase